ncbi:MAG: AMP-binding protein, partial [Rhizobiales bacterium]|nr:AMP-binding protein [Hyphomicrobiales bacterium]
MSGFVLLRPWWLAALPLLAALAFWPWRRGPMAGGWGQVMTPAMLAAMRALGHLRRDDAGASLMPVVAAALVGLGLAGPAIPRADAPQFAGSGAVLVAIGLSPGVAGAALADAQAAAASVMAAAAGRPVGLILYSDEAYDVAAPTGDPAVLESLIAVLGPDTMLAPPRIWENMLTQMQVKAGDATPLKRHVFEFFRGLAERCELKRSDGKRLSLTDRLGLAVGEVVVYGPVRDQLGLRKARWCYTGGAPLGPDTYRFFRSFGINLKQVYGATEASAMISCQS